MAINYDVVFAGDGTLVLTDGDRTPDNMLSLHMSTDGLGGGTKEVLLDYSIATGTPTDFYLEPPTGETWYINRLIGFMQFTGGFRAERYADFAAALTNGIKLSVQDGSGAVKYDATGSDHVVSNAGWAHQDYDINAVTWGAGDSFVSWRWSFFKDGGPLKLIGSATAADVRKFVMTAQDDFSVGGLSAHSYICRGWKSV